MTPGLKVSVAVICYNQVRYISQALRSIVEQDVNFSFEVVVGDDCSEDGTNEVVQEFASARPDLIRVLSRSAKLGAFKNGVDVEEHCCGEYVAWLEGDDYWLDMRKLQMQVEFLDSNEDCVQCFGLAREIWEEEPDRQSVFGPKIRKSRYTLEDVLQECFVPTCTVMYRRGLLKKLPSWFTSLPQSDWSTCLLLAEHGRLGFIPELLAARRIHRGGLWSGTRHEQRLRAILKSYEAFRSHLGEVHKELIENRINATLFRLAVDLEYHGEREAARESWRINRESWWRNPYVSRMAWLKLAAKFCMPWRVVRATRRAVS